MRPTAAPTSTGVEPSTSSRPVPIASRAWTSRPRRSSRISTPARAARTTSSSCAPSAPNAATSSTPDSGGSAPPCRETTSATVRRTSRTTAPAASSSRSSSTSGSTRSSETGRRTVPIAAATGCAGASAGSCERIIRWSARVSGEGSSPHCSTSACARRLVGVERLLLPPRPEVRKHQETAEPLAIRVLRGQPGGVGNHVVVRAELDLGLDAILERRQPELVEPRDLPLEEALVREVGERRSAPERQRVAEGGRALGGRQRPRIVDEPLEAAGVDHARLRAERIPAGARLDRLLPERVPQTRDGVLHDRFCRRRRPTRPEVVDQRVPRDHRARMQHQIGEHRTLPWTAERDAPFARANLQRAEHEKRGGVVRHGRVRRRYSSSSQKYREGG